MSEPAVEPTVPASPAEPTQPAPAPEQPPAKKSLEDSLASLDEKTRAFVLEEVQSARSEAKNLRERVKLAEPIVAEWERLQEASKTELERAQEEARKAEERTAATLQRVAAAEVKAALTGVVPDPASLLEDLNIGRFVTPEGEVDANAITALREKYAALTPSTPPRMAPNPAQGTSAQTPLGLRERITQAEQAGDMKAALRLKAQQAIGSTQ